MKLGETVMSQTALLEIGVEEIPASVVLPALEQMETLAAQALERLRLGVDEIRTYGTPRRLTIVATGVAERQPDIVKEVKGPPADRAFDENGEPISENWDEAMKKGGLL